MEFECPHDHSPLSQLLNEEYEPLINNVHRCLQCRRTYNLIEDGCLWYWVDIANSVQHTISDQAAAAALDAANSTSAVLLVEWVEPRGDFDNIGVIRKKLEEFYDTQPASFVRPIVQTLSITNANPDDFLAAIKDKVVACGDALLILYVDGHGGASGLSQDTNQRPSTTASYQQFGVALREALRISKANGVSLILGSCFAMAETTNLRNFLPHRISSVAGYTGEPMFYHTTDVAASVIKYNILAFQEILRLRDEAFSCRKQLAAVEEFNRLLQERVGQIEGRIPDPSDQRLMTENPIMNEGIGVLKLAVRKRSGWNVRAYPLTLS